MKMIDVTRRFKTDEDCLDYIEQMRWPNGELGCVHCGLIGHVSRIVRQTKSKNQRNRIFQCTACGKQFSATSGTIFNDSHLSLVKWFLAIAIICEAKKGVSAKQLERHLGVNYRTAWYLCHRIREAMQEGGLLTGVVEADETYIGPKKPRKGHPRPKKQLPDVVLGMVERGGRLRLVPVADAKVVSIEPQLLKHLGPDAFLQTDTSMTYGSIGRRHFVGRHRMVDHIFTYGTGINHTNTIENAFSLLKRGIYGTFHRVSIKHLGRYCNEFSYRFNRRGQQLQMFAETMKHLTRGKALTYEKLTASPEVSA